jgi:hypothetical protein
MMNKNRPSFRASNGWVSAELKEGDHFVPITTLSLGIPWIKFNKEQSGDFGDSHQIWSFEAPTAIRYAVDQRSGWRSFSLIVFGFGFNITRQTSY